MSNNMKMNDSVKCVTCLNTSAPLSVGIGRQGQEMYSVCVLQESESKFDMVTATCVQSSSVYT